MSGPREGGGQGVQTPPPPKNHKDIGFLSNTNPDHLESQSYHANIQRWDVFGPPAKRCFAGGPMMAHLYWYLDPHTQKIVRHGPPLSKLSGSAHDIYVYLRERERERELFNLLLSCSVPLPYSAMGQSVIVVYLVIFTCF